MKAREMVVRNASCHTKGLGLGDREVGEVWRNKNTIIKVAMKATDREDGGMVGVLG